VAEAFPGLSRGEDPLPPGGFRPGWYLGPDTGCPPEFADVPVQELFAEIDTARQQRAAVAARESLGAGFRPRGPLVPSQSGSGFESGGALDTSPPGGTLAGLADAFTRNGGLADVDDDELIGALRAWQRIESWASANGLAAIAELARRRPAQGTPPAPPGQFPTELSEFLSDEVAAALTLTGQAASTHTELGLDLAVRLPATFRAHHQGRIDRAKARLIADATRILPDEDARAVETQILAKAAEQTTGQLRAALARAVIAVDPEAAARRREEAQKDPRVRRWQEDAGTAALAGYGLPPAEVLAADHQLTTRALALRDAGLPGSLEELRARAYLDALLDRDPTPAPPIAPRSDAPPARDATPARRPSPATQPVTGAAAPVPGPRPAGPAPASRPAGSAPAPGPVDLAPASRPAGPARDPAAAPAPMPGPRLPALINLTVPLATQLGLTNTPATVAGFGPVDGPLARQLTNLAATDPRTRCCLTLTSPSGQAIGHGCLPGPAALAHLGTQPVTVTITPLARGSCDHRHQEPGYQPSRKLRHLITARTPTCTAPGCRHPAARCDLDHTNPYDQGGRTCECGLAPLCRHHHRCKQSEGWRLEQPEPGVMIWTTPASRKYRTTPDPYV
jgi:uncharacterized protein DUF222